MNARMQYNTKGVIDLGYTHQVLSAHVLLQLGLPSEPFLQSQIDFAYYQTFQPIQEP